MHLTRKCHGRQPRPWRPSLIAALACASAAFAGSAPAAVFDEKVNAPRMKNAAELRLQAQGYSANHARFLTTDPVQLVNDAGIVREHVDLVWKLQRAIDEHRPLGDGLDAVGLMVDENGGVSVDVNAFPQWIRFDERLSELLPEWDLDGLGRDLVARGFRAEDAAILKDYVLAHDVRKLTAQRALPIALSFNKLVRKYDKLKRPVDEATVLAYHYQQARMRADTSREWAAGLLAALDAQRGRILLEYVSEPKTRSTWSPSNESAALADTLALMRRPDFNERASAEAQGVRQ